VEVQPGRQVLLVFRTCFRTMFVRHDVYPLSSPHTRIFYGRLTLGWALQAGTA
jgi:hypothetical protein